MARPVLKPTHNKNQNKKNKKSKSVQKPEPQKKDLDHDVDPEIEGIVDDDDDDEVLDFGDDGGVTNDDFDSLPESLQPLEDQTEEIEVQTPTSRKNQKFDIEEGNLEEFKKLSEKQFREMAEQGLPSGDDEDEDDEEGTKKREKQIRPKRDIIYNREALEEKRLQLERNYVYAVNKKNLTPVASEDLEHVKKVSWLERLDLTTRQPLVVEDPQNDLDRELKFYNQALETVVEGLSRFDSLSFPYRRPDDYFAEMIKTDEHMHRIRAKLQMDKEEIEGKEERRKQRDLKKFGKKIQVQRIQEKQKQKRENLDTIKKWRQNRKKDGRVGLDDDDDLDQQLGITPKSRPIPKGGKRLARDQKYGHGGRKSGSKRNTRDSTNEGTFNQKENRSLPRALRLNSAAQKFDRPEKTQKTRPGKNRRQKGRR